MSESAAWLGRTLRHGARTRENGCADIEPTTLKTLNESDHIDGLTSRNVASTTRVGIVKTMGEHASRQIDATPGYAKMRNGAKERRSGDPDIVKGTRRKIASTT